MPPEISPTTSACSTPYLALAQRSTFRHAGLPLGPGYASMTSASKPPWCPSPVKSTAQADTIFALNPLSISPAKRLRVQSRPHASKNPAIALQPTHPCQATSPAMPQRSVFGEYCAYAASNTLISSAYSAYGPSNVWHSYAGARFAPSSGGSSESSPSVWVWMLNEKSTHRGWYCCDFDCFTMFVCENASSSMNTTSAPACCRA